MAKIYGITGAKASGKSMAAAYFAKPSEIHRVVYVDTENSASSIRERLSELSLAFGAFINMYERFSDIDLLGAIAEGEIMPWVDKRTGKALVEYWQYFIKHLDEALSQKDSAGQPLHRYLAIDTMGPVLAAMVAVIEADPRAYGWSRQTAYGKLEVEGVRPLWENLFASVSQRGVTDIILTSHVKPVWHDKRPVLGKVKPGGRTAVLSRFASQWWWLVNEPGNADGAPAALKLKGRLEKTGAEGDEWVHQQVLPERIPHFTWRDVRGYIKDPFNSADPKPGEVMSQSEREMLSEFLTSAQMELMVALAKLDAQEAAQDDLVRVSDRKVTVKLPARPLESKSVSLESRLRAYLAEHGTFGTPAEMAAAMGAPTPVVFQAVKKIRQQLGQNE